ncbi:hypothetical protein PQX77_009165 [Marasmius sp. AFHP31]|nr:hypothetical protein PQX77_009165 [Marasmius sp. AFHP31]
MSSEGRAPGIPRVLWDRIRDDLFGDWDNYNIGVKMFSILLVPLGVVARTVDYAINADSDIRPQPERGNVFSAGIAVVTDSLPFNLMFSSAVILGVFHCIPIMLNYCDFPGHTIDHHTWTAFALAITGLPLGPWIVHILNSYGKIDRIIRSPFISYPTVLATLLYPIARIALIVLAVKQLIDLPPSALRQVEWTNLIPHFGV